MAPGIAGILILLSILLLSALTIPSAAQQCSNMLTISNTQRNFTQCLSLTQGASIAWTYFAENQTLDIAFTGALLASGGWAGWGYNPTRANMAGSSALIAFNDATSSQPRLFLYSVTEEIRAGSATLQPVNSTADITAVLAPEVEILQDSTVRFTARLRLARSNSNVFQVWNRGNSVSGNSPQAHPGPSDSTGSLDLATGAASQAGVPRLRLMNAHGILNALGWGILLPIGAMSARYLRPFEWADPAWFYIHASCQSLGYILGVVGWAFGLKLGSDSVGVRYDRHRSIGITLFVFGSLQVFAIILRPNKSHKSRMFWNVYHHTIGYLTIVLAIVNIFKGFDILNPAKGWKNAYIGIIIALGVLSLILEVVTWIAYFQRKSRSRKSAPLKNGNAYTQDQFMGQARV